MADASQVLGAQEVAGTFLSPKGTMKKVTTASAGRMVGGLAGAVGTATGQSLGGQGEGTPTFGQLGYLAVTDEDVALVRAKTGAIKPKLVDEVLGRRPRSQLERVDYEKGSLKGKLEIHFTDGGLWEFEIPRAHHKATTKVVEALSTSG
jgi:hypothetical protein